MKDRHSFGVGLRSPHFSELKSKAGKTSIEWFEVISENFMDSLGRPRKMLHWTRERFPVALHGVGLSIGSKQTPSTKYLKSLKNLVDEIEPFIVSDHFCWTGIHGAYTHDLLPLPFTQESISNMIENIDLVQNHLKRKITLENISAYLSFRCSEMSEAEFISEIVATTHCKTLLDINNVYVNSVNHHFDPYQFIDQFPLHSVQQIHLAGHTDLGTHLLDTHSGTVSDPVLDLYQYTLKKIPHTTSILLEWDEDLPKFDDLEKEINRIKDQTQAL